MKPVLLACAAACLAFPQEPIRVDVNLVNVGFSVRDARGNLVKDLAREDFDVVEDGAAQNIAFFARGAEVPLHLGLILDFSSSQARSFKQHHRDLETFLKTVLAVGDRAFLMCFGDRLLIAAESSGVRDLLRGLERYERGEREFPELAREERIQGTAFFDALYWAASGKLAGGEHGRKALVVFSDGEDNSSAYTMMDAIDAAQNASARCYGIRYTERNHGRLTARNQYGTRAIARIARETGGADFDAEKADLRTHFRAIGEELRGSYELGYYSNNLVRDGSFRKISIRVGRPGLTVRAKTGYYAR